MIAGRKCSRWDGERSSFTSGEADERKSICGRVFRSPSSHARSNYPQTALVWHKYHIDGVRVYCEAQIVSLLVFVFRVPRSQCSEEGETRCAARPLYSGTSGSPIPRAPAAARSHRGVPRCRFLVLSPLLAAPVLAGSGNRTFAVVVLPLPAVRVCLETRFIPRECGGVRGLSSIVADSSCDLVRIGSWALALSSAEHAT